MLKKLTSLIRSACTHAVKQAILIGYRQGVREAVQEMQTDILKSFVVDDDPEVSPNLWNSSSSSATVHQLRLEAISNGVSPNGTKAEIRERLKNL